MLLRSFDRYRRCWRTCPRGSQPQS
jgi:hypothetical protein